MSLSVKVDRQCPRCRGRFYHRAKQIKGCTFEAYCTNCGHQWRVRLRKTRDEFPQPEGEIESAVALGSVVREYGTRGLL